MITLDQVPVEERLGVRVIDPSGYKAFVTEVLTTGYCGIERESEPRGRRPRHWWRAEALALQVIDGETVDEPATAEDEDTRKPRTLADLPKDERLGTWVKDTYGQVGYVSGFYYGDTEVCYPNKGHDVDQHRAADLEVLDLPRVDLPVTVPKPEAVKPTSTIADVHPSQWKGLRVRMLSGEVATIEEARFGTYPTWASWGKYVLFLKEIGSNRRVELSARPQDLDKIVILDDTEEATE